MGADLERLLRWEGAGGTWQVVTRRGGMVEVALLTCSGGEEMGRLRSSAPDFVAYVEEHRATGSVG